MLVQIIYFNPVSAFHIMCKHVFSLQVPASFPFVFSLITNAVLPMDIHSGTLPHSIHSCSCIRYTVVQFIHVLEHGLVMLPVWHLLEVAQSLSRSMDKPSSWSTWIFSLKLFSHATFLLCSTGWSHRLLQTL